MASNTIQSNDILNKYLVVNLGSSKYVIRIKDIAEVKHCTGLTFMPSENPAHKGVINRRDEVVSVIDLRVLLGMECIEKEMSSLISMLKEREQDHKEWVNELISSVDEHREFQLTSNPHACKFGVWFDNYKSESYIVNHFLDRFVNPHKRIHDKALEIKEIIETKGYEAAKKIAEDAKEQELNELLGLFSELYEILQSNFTELVIIFKINNKYQALTADSVDKIITFEESAIDRDTHFSHTDIIEGTVLFNGQTIPLIDETKIFNASKVEVLI